MSVKITEERLRESNGHSRKLFVAIQKDNGIVYNLEYLLKIKREMNGYLTTAEGTIKLQKTSPSDKDYAADMFRRSEQDSVDAIVDYLAKNMMCRELSMRVIGAVASTKKPTEHKRVLKQFYVEAVEHEIDGGEENPINPAVVWADSLEKAIKKAEIMLKKNVANNRKLDLLRSENFVPKITQVKDYEGKVLYQDF